VTRPSLNGRSNRTSKRTLTFKQEKFADGVAAGKSAAAAARDAGYSPRSARQIASENLSKPDVQGRIAARISESGVDPREVIGTLASHMRADMTDFFDGDLPEVIGIAAQRGLGHLIKRIKIRRWVEGKGDNAKKVEEIDFEIARDNPAAVQLSKILRLDHVPHVNINVGLDEQRQVNFLVSLVRQAHAQALSEGEQITIEAVLDEVIGWEKQYQDKDLSALKPVVLQRLSDGAFGIVKGTGGSRDGQVTADGAGGGCIEQSA